MTELSTNFPSAKMPKQNHRPTTSSLTLKSHMNNTVCLIVTYRAPSQIQLHFQKLEFDLVSFVVLKKKNQEKSPLFSSHTEGKKKSQKIKKLLHQEDLKLSRI